MTDFCARFPLHSVAPLQDKSGLAAKWTKPIRVAVSGAAGAIANQLLFKARPPRAPHHPSRAATHAP